LRKLPAILAYVSFWRRCDFKLNVFVSIRVFLFEADEFVVAREMLLEDGEGFPPLLQFPLASIDILLQIKYHISQHPPLLDPFRLNLIIRVMGILFRFA